MKAESADDEKSRVKTLPGCAALHAEPDATIDELARLAAEICGTPMAAVTLIDNQWQWFKARVGIDVKDLPREEALCAHALERSGEILEIADARNDPRFAGLPLVTGKTGVRFYAGALLVTAEGLAIGSLCVLDREPRNLNEGQRAALGALSRQVVALLELRRQAGGPRREATGFA